MPTLRTALVHPTSNPFARNAALALAEIGILKEVITTLRYDSSLNQYLNLFPDSLSQSIISELSRRSWDAPEGTKIYSHRWQELLRILLVKLNLAQCLGHGKVGPISWVYTSLDRHVAQHHLSGLDAIYAYEDGAAATFMAAKQQGIFCLYDLPILFYKMAKDIQLEEAECFPELASSLQATREPEWKLQRKEQEIQLADHIFVASSISRESVLREGIERDRISVIPYGAPVEYFQPAPKQDSVFRVLFVGRVGARKGIHYLIQAWKTLKLPQAELMLIGVNELPQTWLHNLPDSVRYLASVPHSTLNQYYCQANVFVFPSLVEGFGLVLLEAMACGIPVITTPNTAGPDIITNGVEGFIIPIRDPEALLQKLEWCHKHPKQLAEMGRAARQRAEQLTWQRYRETLGQAVIRILTRKP